MSRAEREVRALERIAAALEGSGAASAPARIGTTRAERKVCLLERIAAALEQDRR